MIWVRLVMWIECFLEGIESYRVRWQLNFTYVSRMSREQVTHLEHKFYIRLPKFVNCFESAHNRVSEDIFVKYVTSTSKVKCSIGLFWSWI